jgi:two-component system KDP operon response regulator KdpE
MQAVLFAHHNDESAVLSLILQQAGFRVRLIRSLDDAISAWPEQPLEFILIALPDDRLGAIEQVGQLRGFTAVPILVISDPLPEDLFVNLLEEGADLLVLKPYSVRGLLAQIRSLLRRTAGVPFYSLPTLSQSDISLDPSNRTVTVGSKSPKHLTQLEFRLLYTLMTHRGQVIPSENIVENVWGYSGEGSRDLVRGLVQRLRSKVEPDPKQPQYIFTVSGVGYRFDPPLSDVE